LNDLLQTNNFVAPSFRAAKVIKIGFTQINSCKNDGRKGNYAAA
jgi:hypothetical protein